jgi:vomeronasal 2 receptor
MAPKVTHLALAMISFILYFNWNWVSLVITDDDQGNQFLSELKKESENKEICFAFVNIFTEEQFFYHKTEMYHNQIVMSSTNVIIIYGEKHSIIELSFRIWESPVIQRIWITTKQWNFPASKRNSTPAKLYGMLFYTAVVRFLALKILYRYGTISEVQIYI